MVRDLPELRDRRAVFVNRAEAGRALVGLLEGFRASAAVVLGLISTKLPELEPVDELKRRIDEAAKYVPLERLAVSPQCGFGSDVVGNLISEDDQKRKLELVVETARQVWDE